MTIDQQANAQTFAPLAWVRGLLSALRGVFGGGAAPSTPTEPAADSEERDAEGWIW